ncbi:MAG: DUF664 domain-containing protein [Candidatus Eisenbacteria bacterium]|uniref:DUF664 domain-containing protein n=1 Tax=Eiseniibacteriota bacterium TaxID=2212470 RepID=A0A849SNB7_UNCEI|nr:DUF664 domain-containing protein [Candidatus Eisenbacteria bacterium]
MSTNERLLLELPPGQTGFGALTIAQLEELTRYLWDDLGAITPAELQWQPSRGHNTIGMLLAHLAVVEVFWTQVGVIGLPEPDTDSVLGMGIDDDGLPLPADAEPPAGLADRDLAWYRDKLEAARRYAAVHLLPLTDAELGSIRIQKRRTGGTREFNLRWVLFHLLEHFAGHYGQILLIRHRYRDVAGDAAR